MNINGGFIINFKSKLMIVLIISLIFILISSVSAQTDDTDIVKDIDDNKNKLDILKDNGDVDGSFTDLATEISGSSSINLTKNYVFDSSKDSSYKNGIVINKNMVINGNGHIIDGNHSAKMFQITSGRVYLNNITFVNSNTSSNGGMIYFAGTYLNISNSCFKNASIKANGAAIFINSGTADISNSDFINNVAEGNSYSGSIYINGGATVNIYKSNFIGNVGNAGGAIYHRGNYLNIYDSYFFNNTSRGDNNQGGAVCISGAAAHQTIINNSTFIKNKAFGSGGAIFANTGVDVKGSLFVENQAVNGAVLSAAVTSSISDSIILNNLGTTSTAANKLVHNQNTNTMSLNNNWWGSDSSNYNNILAVIGAYPTRSTLTSWYFLNMGSINSFLLSGSENVNFRLNQISNSQGVISSRDLLYSNPISFNLSSSSGILNKDSITLDSDKTANFTFTAEDVGIYKVYADYLGFRLTKNIYYVPDDSLSALNITIANSDSVLNLTKNYEYYPEYDFDFINKAIPITKSFTINGNGYSINGKNQARIFNVTTGDFIVNNITIEGANSYQGGAIYFSGNKAIINNSVFQNNHVSDVGGALTFVSGEITVENSKFIKNSASYAGSAIRLSANAKLFNCDFLYNSDGGGVAIDSDSCDIIINQCNFIQNTGRYRSGGAIRSLSGKMIINNSQFSNNRAGIHAGAIYMDHGLIINSIFKNNSAISSNLGGAVYIASGNSLVYNCTFISNSAYEGGAIYGRGTNITIDKSNFENNRVTAFGGAIFLVSSQYSCINNSYFSGNNADSGSSTGGGNGGIIYLESSAINTVINNITAFDNHCGSWGSAIYSAGDGTKLYNSRFTENSYNAKLNYGGTIYFTNKHSEIVNCYFADNLAYKGGAIAATVQNFTLKNSTFIRNTANYRGGALYFNSGSNFIPTNITIIDCIFTNNTSKKEAGAILFGAATSNNLHDIHVLNSIFEGNIANDQGGAVLANNKDSDFVNCTFINNIAKFGGSLYITGTNYIVNNSKFENNKAISSGAGIIWQGTNGKLLNSNFTKNVANENGGGVCLLDAASNLYINNVSMNNNLAGYYGPAIASYAKGTIIHNSTFIANNNTANNYGGAVWIYNTMEIYGSTFKFNNNFYGGAVLSSRYSSSLIIHNSTFIGNIARANGGAVTGFNNYNKILIYDSTFINNSAKSYGGAISLGGESSGVFNSKFYNNTATYGGAINSAGNKILINNSDFKNNSASNYAGAIVLGASSTVSNSNFTLNFASNYGGSVYARGNNAKIMLSNFINSTSNVGGAVYLISGNQISISKSNFTDNVARNIAGAVYVNAKNAEITLSNFDNNTARSYAGAVYINLVSTIDSSNFTKNMVSNGYGGAIHVAGANSKLIKGIYNNNTAKYGGAINIVIANGLIDGAEFNNNTAIYGGAIYWNGIGGKLSNSKLNNNNATYGGAAYINRENVNIILSNFTNNTATTQGGAVYVLKNNNVINRSNFDENKAFSGGALYLYGNNTKVDLTNFTSNYAEYGAGFYVVDHINLTNSNFTSNVAGELGGAGYSFVFISRYVGNNTFTYWDDLTHTDDLYASFVRLLNETIFTGQNLTLKYSTPGYTGSITLLIDGSEYETVKVPGDETLLIGDVDNLPYGVYDHIFAVYHSSDEFNNSYALVSLTVKRLPVNVELMDNVSEVDGTIRVKVNETSAQGNITVEFEGGYQYTGEITDNGIATIKLDNHVLSGLYNVTLYYSGDFNFDESNNISTLQINKVNFKPRFLYNWTYIEGDVVIVLPDDIGNGDLSVKIGSFESNQEVSNNLITFELPASIGANIYDNVVISYSGDEKYNQSTNITLFEVLKYPCLINLENNVIEVNEKLVFDVSCDYDGGLITGQIQFEINGETYTGTLTHDEEGGVRYTEIDTSRLVGGVYENVSVLFISTNNKYNDSKRNFTFILNKLESTITFNGPREVTIDGNLTFMVDEGANGNVSFVIGGNTYNATIHNGVAHINISGLAKGVYENVLVLYSGDDYYKSSNITIDFKVKEYPKVNLTIENIVYGQNATLKVNITPNDVSGRVVVYVNKTKKFDSSITSGIFDINLADLQQGKYIVNLTYFGDDKHFSGYNSINLFVFRANSTVAVKDIVNGTFNTTDSTVSFEIENRTIVSIIVVNENGVVVYRNNTFTLDIFSIKSLNAGIYNITISNAQSRNYNASNKTVSFRVIKASSEVNITDIVNGVYNTTNVEVNFEVYNRTTVTIIIKNSTGDIVYQNNNFELSKFIIGNLTAGDYNITILNGFNNNYNASNMTKSFKVIKATSKITINNITNGIYNTTHVFVNFTATNRTTISILVYKNGTDICVFNNTDFQGNIFTIGNLSAGIYNITIFNKESDNYNSSQISRLFEVLKAYSFVNITEINHGVYNTTNATVKFDVTNKTTVKIVVYKNGTDSCVFNSTNFEGNVFSIGNLSSGIYNITITNVPNENYTEYSVSSLFIVNKATSFVNITGVIPGVYNTTNATVNFNIVNGTSVKIIITKNGTGTIVYNASSFILSQFTINNLTAGVYNITITNTGDDNHLSSVNSTLFTVYRAKSSLNITNVVNATFNTTSVEVSFDINNRTVVSIIIHDAEGREVYRNESFSGNIFSIDTLNAGIYNITVTNNQADNYNESCDSKFFSVYKANSEITIVNVTDGFHKIDPAIITINVINRTVVFYTVTTLTGEFVLSGNTSTNKIVINDLSVGFYNITVFNNESMNYNPSNATALFSIVKSYSKVNITSITDGILNTQNVTVKFDVLAPTIINIIVMDVNGTVVYNNSDFKEYVFSIGNLTTGLYNISIYNLETDNAYASNDSALFKVVVPTTIISNDINRGYNSSYDYVAVFIDEFGNKLNNTNVSMIVDGIRYNMTTNEDGVAYLNTTTLSVGNHTIQLINPVSGEITNHKINIVERLQENKDIVMDFCDGTYYSVRAYGDDGQPIAGVTVTITVNGVSYDVVTDKDGYAVLKIRLNPKTYTITAEWNDYKINKIVVRQTLKAKSVKVKKSANKFKYSASLKLSTGKPIVGEIITFKFKGKTYKAKTNKKGIAKITINKKVLSKLKVGKKYKIKITYNHVDNGYTSVNSIAKKIKIKN